MAIFKANMWTLIVILRVKNLNSTNILGNGASYCHLGLPFSTPAEGSVDLAFFNVVAKDYKNKPFMTMKSSVGAML